MCSVWTNSLWKCVYMCASSWKPEVDVKGLSWLFSSLNFTHIGRISHLSPELPNCASPAGQFAPGSCVCLLHARTTGGPLGPPGIWIDAEALTSGSHIFMTGPWPIEPSPKWPLYWHFKECWKGPDLNGRSGAYVKVLFCMGLCFFHSNSHSTKILLKTAFLHATGGHTVSLGFFQFLLFCSYLCACLLPH